MFHKYQCIFLYRLRSFIVFPYNVMTVRKLQQNIHETSRKEKAVRSLNARPSASCVYCHSDQANLANRWIIFHRYATPDLLSFSRRMLQCKDLIVVRCIYHSFVIARNVLLQHSFFAVSPYRHDKS